jgi:RNase H-like domain found in reverse transcriptase
MTAVRLGHPNYDLPMEVHPDARGHGIGCALVQTVDGCERPLAFAIRVPSASELILLSGFTEKEWLALLWATKKFRVFIWVQKIKVYTDHQALRWLMTKKSNTKLHHELLHPSSSSVDQLLSSLNTN